jgi:hypothetical protein
MVMTVPLSGAAMDRTTLALSILMLAAGPASAQNEQTPAKQTIDSVSVRGCVAGNLLKSTAADIQDPTGRLTSSRYRLKSKGDVKRQLKELNGRYVEVRGSMPNVPNDVVRTTKLGGTTVSIGARPANDPMMRATVPETPAIDVESIVEIERECPS